MLWCDMQLEGSKYFSTSCAKSRECQETVTTDDIVLNALQTDQKTEFSI